MSIDFSNFTATQTMTIHDIITEIQSLNNESTRKAVFEINRILQNNKIVFLKHIDADHLNSILQHFENLSQASHKEYTTENYTTDYSKHYNLLMYYCNKIG
jgi:hypothetical protein